MIEEEKGDTKKMKTKAHESLNLSKDSTAFN